jgi:hypothetical protein
MSREVVRLTRTVAVVACLLLWAGPTAAQTPTPAPTPAPPSIAPLKIAPLPWLVIDARGGFAKVGTDGTTAAGLGVSVFDLPSRARTLVVGAHVYPLRRGRMKLGFGSELLMGTGSRQKKDAAGKPDGLPVHRRLYSVSGQVSLNFGKGGGGWSYITAGGGPFKFESYLGDATPDGLGTTTINYGGGARWFTRSHLAFTVDLRFYLTRPATAMAVAAARARERVLLLSAGISLK